MDYNPDGSSKNLTNRTYMTIGYVPEDKINNMGWIPLSFFDGRWVKNFVNIGSLLIKKVNESFGCKSWEC